MGGCDLDPYEQVYVELADGSVAETDACVPDITGERCDGVDNDCDRLIDDDDPDVWSQTQSDPYHCGGCFQVCDLQNVDLHGCREGACTIATCDQGYSDNNGIAEDGCEDDCIPTSSFDYCDGVDNNCDGQTDESFDLQNDVHNCGECGFSCVVEYGDPSVGSYTCEAGQCQVAVCLPNQYDINGDVSDGCEYPCVENSPVELCDGADNDCDGEVDNNPQDAPACDADGVCAGTQPVCTPAGLWECDYEANALANGWVYESNEGTDNGCDELDNDCDGVTDEGYNVGQPCFAGEGACRSQGTYVCTADTTSTECDATPDWGQQDSELCDGVDNDCDGDVDELDPSDPDLNLYGSFIYISSGDFTIFAHEASRPSATSGDEGFGDDGMPCSVADVRPWSNLAAVDLDSSGDAEVREVCQRLGPGWDLCTATQWYTACAGAGGQSFPYGNSYASQTCNGYDYGVNHGGAGPVDTGTLSGCQRAGVYDLSGNLKEWVRDGGDFEVRGGAYNNVSDGSNAPGLQCDGTSPMPADTEVHLPSIGFRCCYAGAL